MVQIGFEFGGGRVLRGLGDDDDINTVSEASLPSAT